MIVLYGGLQAIEGHITAGTVVAFVAALSYLFDPIQQLSQLYTTYQSGMAALEKIFQLLDVRPDLEDRPDAHRAAAHRRRGLLRGRLLRLLPPAPSRRRPMRPRRRRPTRGQRPRSRRGRPGEVRSPRDRGAAALALEHVSLDIPPGQTVALVGATGAGKSTMAKLVARFYDPTDGRVLVDGHDLRDISSSSLRSQMGIVPQEAFLFSGTIAENIAFGRPDADERADPRRRRGRRRR